MKYQITSYDFPYIQSMAELFCNSFGIHLCIHDLSGILRPDPALEILLQYKYHNSAFCSTVKSCALGSRYCAMCKYLSLKRITQEKKEYFGACYMNINEIVKPVLIDDRLVAVIYLGNFYLKENQGQVYEKMKKAASMIGVPEAILQEQFNTVRSATSGDVAHYYKIAEVLSQSIILAYRGMFAKKNMDLRLGAANRKSWLIQSVKDYVHVHYYNSIRLDYIAKINFFNTNYLSELFKKETGKTFTEYLNSVRLDKAKELLCKTDMKVIDISFQVGFENVTYFNRIFKKTTGTTPLDFRAVSRLT